jgi:hypothetical protein
MVLQVEQPEDQMATIQFLAQLHLLLEAAVVAAAILEPL